MGGTQGANILLVEDDDVLSSVIERNLQVRGHHVAMAADVQEALHHLRTDTFDLILLDINLPDQTGWDVLRAALAEGRLRRVTDAHESSDPHAGKLPVVVLSAVRVSPQRLSEFHPLAYLPKPFPMDAVLRLAAEAAARRMQQENDWKRVEKNVSSSLLNVTYCDEEAWRA
jgi:CheY-like chemotaxis protein